MKVKRIRGTNAIFQVKLSESDAVPNELQYLRVGKFNHPKYGEFEVTSKVLAEMVQNFNAKVRGIDVCFDYFHNSDQEASGWPRGFELREGGSELWAVGVDWTPTATKKLAEREIRYFSPDFAFKWEDPETGKVFNNVIFGGGLTNRPFVKEMAAIVADETEGDEMPTELEKLQAKVKELEAANLKLSGDYADLQKKMPVAPPADDKPPVDGNGDKKLDDNAHSGEEGSEVAALKKTIADLQAQLAKAQSDSEKTMGEKKKLEEAMAMAEKAKEFGILLSEGKACAAQKDSFMKGDMKEFIRLAEPVNLKAQGSGAGGDATNDDIGKDFDEKVVKLAEEKVKSDPKLKLHEAIKLAHVELRNKV